MDCRLKLLVHVIAHLVTTDAKRLRIRDFQCGPEVRLPMTEVSAGLASRIDAEVERRAAA